MTLFYTALHYIEHFFSLKGVGTRSHFDRSGVIAKECPPEVHRAYRRLEDESKKARYMENGAFCLGTKAVDSELRRKKLRVVQRFVLKEIRAARSAPTSNAP